MTSHTSQAELPTDPIRVKAFARFFKNYMSTSSIVTAALPIPVTSLGFIPTFQAQTKLLSTYASLFCFLILGFVFYTRHEWAHLFFPQVMGDSARAVSSRAINRFFTNLRPALARAFTTTLPLLLILLALALVFEYHTTLDASILKLSGSAPEKTILKTTELWHIPNSSRLILLYIAIFLSAELAFVLMAVKEYLQDLLHLSDFYLITGNQDARPAGGPPSESRSRATSPRGVPPAPRSGAARPSPPATPDPIRTHGEPAAQEPDDSSSRT